MKNIVGVSGKVDFFLDGNITDVYFPIPPDLILDEESIEDYMKGLIGSVYPINQGTITNGLLQYSFSDFTPYSGYDTVVEVNLPFVLHIPNYTQINLTHPKTSKVFLQKIWTGRSKGSYDFDVVGSVPLYYRDGYSVTPRIPHDPSENWNWTTPESKNIDELSPTGNLRYSKINIHYNTNFSLENIKGADFQEKYLQTFYNDCLEIINSILSSYRNCMQEYTIELLDHVEIMSIYFPKFGFGCYPLLLNFQSALINKEHSKIKSFIKGLENNLSIPNYDICLDNANSAILKRQFRTVIIDSFGATDLLIESYIINKLNILQKTLNDIGIDEKKAFWSTKIGLKDGWKIIFGNSFQKEYPDLYKKWNLAYKNIRNKTIHAGYNPSEKEAIECLELNQRMMATVKEK